ncbi:MAG: putative rane-anchored protein [Actinomycetia bacterium]|nr:putative rane-anchored protein [Actinomycetes bacterium]
MKARRAEQEVVRGIARVDRRTKDLARRVRPGEIAIINHRDIDRVAAESLVAAGVAAVVNAAPSISGRYPNSGPLRLVEAGIPLVDDVGRSVMDLLSDGDTVDIVGGAIVLDGEVIAKGEMPSCEELADRMEVARLGIADELREFARNTLEYVEREAPLTFEALDVPELSTEIRGRHALIVVRGHDYRHDLAALRPYIKEYRPVLIAVDGGADALLEVGLQPDIIIGDFDSASDRAVHCGADLVHHVHPDGRAPGRENLLAFGLPYQEFVAEGMSEDVAMLLAYEAGATLIVAVGTHVTMVEFLDKGRKGMASTFLTRLRLGPVLVDAKGVSRLYEGRSRRSDVLLLVGSAFLAMVILATRSNSWSVFIDGFRLWFDNLRDAIHGWF